MSPKNAKAAYVSYQNCLTHTYLVEIWGKGCSGTSSISRMAVKLASMEKLFGVTELFLKL